MNMHSIFITDENGVEKEMKITFTFDANNKKYVVYEELDSNDDEFFIASYNDEGELSVDLTEEELMMAQEVLDAFVDTVEEDNE